MKQATTHLHIMLVQLWPEVYLPQHHHPLTCIFLHIPISGCNHTHITHTLPTCWCSCGLRVPATAPSPPHLHILTSHTLLCSCNSTHKTHHPPPAGAVVVHVSQNLPRLHHRLPHRTEWGIAPRTDGEESKPTRHARRVCAQAHTYVCCAELHQGDASTGAQQGSTSADLHLHAHQPEKNRWWKLTSMARGRW